MRILLHDYPGHPFPVQLSRQLAQRGHLVRHLYAGYNKTPRGDLAKQPDDPCSFSIKPIFIREPLDKYSLVKRWRQEREYGQLLARRILDFQADVLISSNTPLDAQKAAYKAAKQGGTEFVFWLQDVIGIASHKLLRKKMSLLGDWLGHYYIAKEKHLLQNSNHVVAITEDFLPYLREWQVADERVSIIPNWAPLDSLPICPKRNPWAIRHGLDGKFCFMYTGTLGLKHDPATLLQLALRFREKKGVRVVVVSEGPGADWLGEQKKTHGLVNLLLLGFQRFDQLPNVMGTADVLLALLEPEAGVFSVPSKVLSYLCAQRPVLAAIPRENLAARIIFKENAGIVVPPKNNEEFIVAAENLLHNPSYRDVYALNGREYAEANFDVQIIGDQFETIVRSFETRFP